MTVRLEGVALHHSAHIQPAPAADRRRWLLLALLGVAQFMLILDVTVVALALPQMGVELELGRGALTWVVSAYTLTFGGLLLLGGRSADVFGSRVVVLTGATLFTVASMLTGVATNAAVLLGGRVAQGVAAALLSPAALAVVVKTFDGEERNKALGIWSALGGAGSAAGVLLGGLLTAGPGWRWVFFVNVPIGIAVVVALRTVVPSDRPAEGSRRLDVPGALIVTAGSAAAVYGVIAAGERGLGSRAAVVSLAAALLLYGVFAIRQRTNAAPLMDLGILVRPSIAAGTLLILVATALMISLFFLGTFYFQHYRGYGPLVTGLLFLPVAAATIAGAQLAGRRIGTLGARSVSVRGLAIAGAGAAAPAVFEGTVALEAGITIAAFGIGGLFVAASTTALSEVPHHEAGIASGILSTFHEFGGAFGVAVTSSVAAASIAGTSADGFRSAFGLAAIVGALGALVSLVAGRRSPGGDSRDLDSSPEEAELTGRAA